MSAAAISLSVFAVVVSSTAFGIFLNRVLPEQHLSKDPKDTIHMGIGVIRSLGPPRWPRRLDGSIQTAA